MKRWYAIVVGVGAFLVMGAHSCVKNDNAASVISPAGRNDLAQPGKANKAGAEHGLDVGAGECHSDEDCMLFKADCCGCRQGGKQKAITKVSAAATAAELETTCAGILCPQMMSMDKSCKQKSICESGSCVLR